MSSVSHTNVGTYTRSAATGYTCITSAPAAVYGVLVKSTGTGGFQLFASNTATGSTAITGVIGFSTQAGSTINTPLYFPTPLLLPTGFCLRNLPGLDPDLTLFWSPA